MQTPIKPPCRLFGLLARQAPVGLILRRGPTRWVQLNLWHTDTDVIEYGQWFHGRLFERRCDLSPDGSLFIYFASKYGHSQFDTWTAISRPPYFTALALWPKGDSWNGGGLFVDSKTVWLNHHTALPDKWHLPPRWLKVLPSTESYGEDEPYNKQLLRDGWTMLQDVIWQRPARMPIKVIQPSIFQKRHPDGVHVLLMRYIGYDPKRYGSPSMYEFFLRDTMHGSETMLEGATWADLDQRHRLVFTKNDGCLYADELQHSELRPHLIADFNGQQPGDVSTPEWAKVWEQ